MPGGRQPLSHRLSKSVQDCCIQYPPWLQDVGFGPMRTGIRCHCIQFPICCLQPQLIGRLLKGNAEALQYFFKDQKMVEKWFDGFEKCAKHGVNSKRGAAALRHYLFTNREVCSPILSRLPILVSRVGSGVG